jgi:7-cyano-7-deazaguanine synthase
MPPRPPLVLLSGGLDSATVLAAAVARTAARPVALSFRYGQRHVHELDAARAVAAHFNVARHEIIEIDLASVGGSALTDAAIDVPKDRDLAAAHDIPITYVPARNTIFLSYALAWAEVLGYTDIYLGVNALDYSGYPDCRPEYLAAFQAMANLATRAGVEGTGRVTIHAPLITMRKAEIIAWGTELGVPYALTSSCYDPAPDGAACGHCDSCALRRQGFADAGVPDPTRYAAAS